jgi:hypothetical protein
VAATSGRLDGLLAWLEPDSPVGASGWFFVPRVREPGTAERESTGLGPKSDRRMPETLLEGSPFIERYAW